MNLDNNKYDIKGRLDGELITDPVCKIGASLDPYTDILEYVDPLPFYFMLIDEDHHIILVNKAVTHDLGAEPARLLGKYCPKVVHGLDEPFPGCPLEDSVKSGEPSEKEFFDAESGRWVNSAIYPTNIRTEENKAIFVHMIRDITKRKIAEGDFEKSEKRFRTFVENSFECISNIDMDGNFLYVSPTGLKTFGMTLDELKEKHCTELVKPEFKRILKKSLDKAKKGEIVYFEYESVTHFGERWFESTLAPLKDNSGKIVSILRISRDITKRRKMEEKLRNNELLLRGVINAIKEAIITIDDRGLISLFNPAAEKMFGIDKKKMIGKRLKRLMPEKYRSKHQKSMMSFFKSGIPGHHMGKVVELPGLRTDGSVFPMSISFSTARVCTKTYVIAVARDITEQKRKEKEMKKRLMKFRLEDGNLYLAKEQTPILAREAFKDILAVEYGGVVISREPENKFKKLSKKKIEVFWLGGTELAKDQTLRLEEIEEKLKQLRRKSAVLIERLDYLIFKNGFDNTLSFVQRLRDIANFHDLIVILSLDHNTVDISKLQLLEKETNEIEMVHKKRISADLFEILDFVYNKNRIGIKPTYSEIGSDLNISKPTVRKRIRSLLGRGYLVEYIRGYKKVIELTEKAERLF